jgi:hypothetical protein
MKASELIEVLERLIAEKGDCDVVTIDAEYGTYDDVRDVSYDKGDIVIG